MLRDISYRYKIPATIIAVIVVTALAIAIPLISSANDAAKRDLIEHALSLGQDAVALIAAGDAPRRTLASL